MGKWDGMTPEQISELLFGKPMSKECEQQLREISRSDKGLLAQNFRDAECETKEEEKGSARSAKSLTDEETSMLLFGKIMDEKQLEEAIKACPGLSLSPPISG